VDDVKFVLSQVTESPALMVTDVIAVADPVKA